MWVLELPGSSIGKFVQDPEFAVGGSDAATQRRGRTGIDVLAAWKNQHVDRV